MLFRVPAYFSGLRVCSLPFDAERKRTDQLSYQYELVLRSGPRYHPGISIDAEFVASYVDAEGWLPRRRSYKKATIASWEWQTRVLLWPSDLGCPVWSVTSMLESGRI